MQKLLFIGGGNMAQAILEGLKRLGTTTDLFHVIDPSQQAASQLASLQVACTANWPPHLQVEVVLLAVKPQMMQSVLNQYAENLNNVLIVSIAAGVSIEQIRHWSQQTNARVVRAMPNTPALVAQGISGLYFTSNCTQTDRDTTHEIFNSFGKILTLNTEEEINAVTAISGSGPGYVFFFMEALAKAAQNLGFNEEQANLLSKQTFLGAATLATHTNDTLASLREKVTSQGGTTHAGLEQLRHLGVHQAIESAAQAAFNRAIELQNTSKNQA